MPRTLFTLQSNDFASVRNLVRYGVIEALDFLFYQVKALFHCAIFSAT